MSGSALLDRPTEAAREAAVPSVSSFAYRPHLDGLRAIAVMIVFIFHAAPQALSGGFVGVDVFFVLSGYLITSILLVQFDQGSTSLTGFYRRRLQRLLPAAFVLVATVIVAESLWGSIFELDARRREAISTVFYVANWNLIGQADDYFAEGLDPSPLRHMWSLAIEEQFYLVWPIVLIACLTLWRGRTRPIGAVVTVAMLLSAGLMVLRYSPLDASRTYYGTDTRVFQPLAGALLAIVLRARPSRWPDDPRYGTLTSQIRRLAGPSLIGIVALAVLLTGTGDAYFRFGAIAVAALTCVLILATEVPGPLTSLLSSRPLVRLGEISYGFYLWHWPVILWIAPPDNATFADRRLVNCLQLAATLAISLVSHRFIESPIRSWRRAVSWKVVTATAASMALTTVAAVALLTPSFEVDPTEPVSAAAARDRSYEPCPDNPRPCVKVDQTGSDAPTVVLIGDSTSQAYDPALKVLAERHGFRYVQAAVGGCPIGRVLLATGRDGELHKQSNFTCLEETPSIYTEVIERWSPDLILATSSNDINQMVIDGELLVRGSAEHLAAADAAIRSSLQELTAGGASAAFIEILPPGPGVTCLERDQPNVGTCLRPVEEPGPADPYNEIYRSIADDLDTVAGVVEFRDVLCPDGVCPLAIDGVVVRYDGGHLTGTMSEALAPLLDRRLRAIGIDLARLGR